MLTSDKNGGYSWYYELNMYKNPTVFITLCKVFGGVIFGCGLLIGLLSQQSFIDTLKFILIIWGCGFGGFLIIGGLSYVIYAAVQGGKYCVVFEMDKKQIVHTQLAKQFEKARVIAALTVLAGVAKGSPGLVGTGLLAGSRATMKTKFEIVDKIKVKRRRNVIYLHSGFEWNQIYICDEDFDTVLQYITERIPEKARNQLQLQNGKRGN